MQIHNQEYLQGSRQSNAAIVVSLDALNSTLLPIAGGKAANLGELIRAGFSVPPGFCMTTAAYIQVSVELAPILADLNALKNGDTARRAELSATARRVLEEAPMPAAVTEAITAAYLMMKNEGDGEPVPVAVRSSATAEDLPYASFAGQQETYLNVVGVEAVLSAVRHCWASLWTERAVSYRESLGFDHRAVRLAVIIQRMIDARVAGVLFTANPLTGKRHQVVIDASPGLGEAVVSGAVNPDHFVVTMLTGEIVERHLGDKRLLIQATAGGGTRRIERAAQSDAACLSDEQVRALAELGARIEAHYGAPQDIEWAIDNTDRLWLLQARPITTLFPLLADRPSNDEELRVYLSFNISQGMTRPFTPMGLSGMRVFISGMIAAFTGTLPREPLQGPGFITEAAGRLYVDVTLALRNALGRRFLFQAAGEAEPHAAAIFEQLITDPRLSLLPPPRWRFLRALLGALIRTRMPLNLLSALLRPSAAWKRAHRLSEEVRQLGSLPANASVSEHLATAESLMLVKVRYVLSGIDAAVPSSLLSFQMASRMLGNLATESELQTVLRGVPHNPTTEMNLALWSLAQRVQADPAQRKLIQETSPAQLVQDYRQRSLPPQLQLDLQHFLAIYGHRSVDEIDLGLARWSEDPTYVLNILASYLQLRDPSQAPDVQYQRAVQEARDMVAELVHRTTRKNWLRGLLVRFCLNRVRALGGMREMGRYILTMLLDRVRMVLWPVGESLARSGCLEKAEDIFFITLPEAHMALAGEDMRTLVCERRATYEQEIARRHVPLILLSDGTEPSAAPGGSQASQDTLQGTPASPGVVTAPARVILDPHGAHLEPGEILVAPTTDPGWTPLFLNAGGLVMEMGGAMSHGVIVAREYGIPAVVGVRGATERIATGSRITVDGTAGSIVLDAGNDAGQFKSPEGA